jgi:hypothetical protein
LHNFLRPPSPARRNWVRFARFTPRPSHTRQLPLPTYPSPTKFGFVLHNLLRPPSPARRNWVRFAQPPSAGTRGRRVEGRGRTARKLGSFCAFRLRAACFNPQSAIEGPRPANWVRFARFTPRPGHTRQLPLTTYPSPTKFGFVLHNFLGQPPAAGRNWVRFVHLPSGTPLGRGKLGSFCAFGLRRAPSAGVS